MFVGFSICSHGVAVAKCNSDLKSFLDASATCAPNLSAIASGAGRKGGILKRKQKTAVPIHSRSVCPCLVGTAGTVTSSISQLAESYNLEPPQSSNIIHALDAQDSLSQCTQGTNDFDLQSILESLTHIVLYKNRQHCQYNHLQLTFPLPVRL